MFVKEQSHPIAALMTNQYDDEVYNNIRVRKYSKLELALAIGLNVWASLALWLWT